MQNKRSKSVTQYNFLFHTGAQAHVASYLNHEDLAQLSRVDRVSYHYFGKLLQSRKLLYWCLNGCVQPLIQWLSVNPESLFTKGDIEDERCKQAFYHVSPFQLILFLRDWDLLKQVMPVIKGPSLKVAFEQSNTLGTGGADLVKLGFDPISAQFSQLLQIQVHDLSFPLLQNKDGILFWNNKLYYANQESKEIRLLATDDQKSHVLIERMSALPDNSSTRSSDEDHALIATLFDIRLHRQGVSFAKNGKRFQDSCFGQDLLNAYRHYLQIDEGQQADVWISGVGGAQRQLPVHLMQRLCANDKFLPLKDVHRYRIQRFTRRELYCDLSSDEKYLELYPLQGLGESFALYKGASSMASAGLPIQPNVMTDLKAFHRLIEVGNIFIGEWLTSLAKVIEIGELPLGFFLDFQLTVNVLQTRRNTVEMSALLPGIISQKFLLFLHQQFGQMSLEFYLDLTQNILNQPGYFKDYIWPLIKKKVYQYGEMELGGSIPQFIIDDLITSFDPKPTVRSLDIDLSK